MINYAWSLVVSWWHGNRIGDIRYTKGLPWIIGNPMHLMPVECWGSSERRSVRFGVNKEEWIGTRWVRVERLELTQSELANILQSTGGVIWE